MIRLAAWLIYRIGLRTALWLALLMLVLGSVALALVDSVRGLDAGLLLPVAVLGLVAGWTLAKSPLPGWLAALTALGLGLEMIVVRIGRLVGPLLALLHTLAGLAWGTWRLSWQPQGGPPDAQPVLLVSAALWADLSTLAARLYHWCLALVSGQSPFDPVAVALVWSLALWAVAAWAAWFVRRREQPLPALSPAGILLAASLFFTWGKPAFLLPLLSVALWLPALVRQHSRQRRWDAAGVDYPGDVGVEVGLAAAALSLVLTAVAVLAPAISMRQILDWTSQLFAVQSGGVPAVAGPVARSRAPARSPATALAEYEVRFPGLPRRHLLGSGPELSEQVVMLISVAAPAGPGAPAMSLPEGPAPRYYWRSVTYDRYDGRGWRTGRTTPIDYQAGQPIVALDALDRSPQMRYARILGQQVQVERGTGGLVYLAGTLVVVDRDYQVAWRSQPAEEDLARGDALGASLAGFADPAAYQVESLVTAAGVAQLRAAGSAYPAWVQNRYLALPDEVPGRVLSVARDLTATEPTPYDRARAIEAYLRTFPYTLDLPVPPSGRDVVDYFLFDLQRGYCDYYATSMVVLARAAGLPARLVVGYASGTYDQARGVYIVTEADAHSWPEIYFPGYGWVEFEPTAGRPSIERPAETPDSQPPDFRALGPILAPRIRISPLWCLSPAIALAVLGLGGVVSSAVERQRLRRLSPQAAVGLLYWRLYRHGQRLAVPVRPGDTPYEFLASLAQRIGEIARALRWGAILEPAAREASWLADLYVSMCYSPYDPDPADQGQAIRAWRRLNALLWLAWLCQTGGFVCRLTTIFSRPARAMESAATPLDGA